MPLRGTKNGDRHSADPRPYAGVALLSENVPRIIIPAGIVDPRQAADTVQIAGIILPVEAPPHFGQRAQARQKHIFGMGPCRDILRPQVGLHAQNTSLLGRRELLVRIEFVDLLHGYVPPMARGSRAVSRVW